jgi:hypothetical protein
MSDWIRALKLREYYVDHAFDHVEEASKQLYLSVIRGEIRARDKDGKIYGPTWLDQFSKMQWDPDDPWALPADLQLSVEDAKKKWG